VNKVFPYLYSQRSNIGENSMHCTLLSSRSAKHQQRACIVAAPSSGQSTQCRIINALTVWLSQCWNWPKRPKRTGGGSAVELFEILPRDWNL